MMVFPFISWFIATRCPRHVGDLSLSIDPVSYLNLQNLFLLKSTLFPSIKSWFQDINPLAWCIIIVYLKQVLVLNQKEKITVGASILLLLLQMELHASWTKDRWETPRVSSFISSIVFGSRLLFNMWERTFAAKIWLTLILHWTQKQVRFFS